MLPATYQEPTQEVVTPGWFFENLIDKKQLAETLKFSISWIDQLMVKGLPYYQLERSVRFRVSIVVAWLQRNKENDHEQKAA